MPNLLTLKQASEWATEYLNRNVTVSNITYLIQYGRIRKIGNNSSLVVDKSDLVKYYKSYLGKRELDWKDKLGKDLNWALSFENVKEAETTKHVHRLHPYKGKFIPQLVEYFIDSHTDSFKKNIFFKKGDTILDPFCGSGTTLIQTNELGIHAIGIDISAFNSFIGNTKIDNYNFADLHKETDKITENLKQFISKSKVVDFENTLLDNLSKFNNKYFPSPEFKYKVKNNEIDQYKYGEKKEKEFLQIFNRLLKEYNVEIKQKKNVAFLDKWYIKNVRDEIDFVFSYIKRIRNISTKKMTALILSRTMRSCRATTHADLATLKEPVFTTYYCAKHGKICKPLFSILKWWEHYCEDTIARLKEFDKIKTSTHQICLSGDSRSTDIFSQIKKKNPNFYKILKDKKIKGIFSSPPYVGLINYHEQHAYAYDLFGFKRKDNLEIGPLFKGRGKDARDSYVKGISEVLINCKKFMCQDYDVFLVANDKFNLYHQIAEYSGMKIVNQFKRPVLNRTEKDKGAYSEIIFHLKRKEI